MKLRFHRAVGGGGVQHWKLSVICFGLTFLSYSYVGGKETRGTPFWAVTRTSPLCLCHPADSGVKRGPGAIHHLLQSSECLEVLHQLVQICCGHMFCQPCIETSVNNKKMNTSILPVIPSFRGSSSNWHSQNNRIWLTQLFTCRLWFCFRDTRCS